METQTVIKLAWILYHQLLDLQQQIWELYEQEFMKIIMEEPCEALPSPASKESF